MVLFSNSTIDEYLLHTLIVDVNRFIEMKLIRSHTMCFNNISFCIRQHAVLSTSCLWIHTAYGFN